MVHILAWLAELLNATLPSASDDKYIIQTTTLKFNQRIAEFKICMIAEERICPLRQFKLWFAEERICPLRWFKSRFSDREPKIPNEAQELWNISYFEKFIQDDDPSKAIRAVMQSAGIIKTYLITSIRAEALTKLQMHHVSSVQVDRFTHHSDTSSSERPYYDKNSNVEAKEVLGQTEKELDNEEDEEQERTLLEEIELEGFNVVQRIPSSDGVLSPELSQLEFSQPLSGIHITQSQTPTEVVDDQKAQYDAANAEKVARLLDPFNIWRVNKQSKSLLFLKEVAFNLKEYKQSSERDEGSSFVPSHLNIPPIAIRIKRRAQKVSPLAGALRVFKQTKSSYLFLRIVQKQLSQCSERD
ncbi:MAG: hypothetical protein EZS28_030024 [Streblomastix strix]|uniref:Uncharacterized protein n=1 Tax=Streblomastix strix TaxID=222440 RepID=A0A5J4UVG7_9EUKA|nr:MAG: hypothetical protein EZS28_030024 [Streblomastix strix]